jgi:hypothetical protein
MMALTLTAEQIRTAPPEIRKWLRSIIETEFKLSRGAEAEPQPRETILAACNFEEAKAVFALVRGDYLAAQVMLELGRHSPIAAEGRRHVVGGTLADLARHARLDNLQQLATCLEHLTAAFRQVRKDGAATLFGYDQAGMVYIHETTYQSFRTLWKGLILGEFASSPEAQQAPAPQTQSAAFAPSWKAPAAETEARAAE